MFLDLVVQETKSKKIITKLVIYILKSFIPVIWAVDPKRGIGKNGRPRRRRGTKCR
jgi:hypothetical protein